MQFLYGKLPTEFSKPLKKDGEWHRSEVRIDPELGELYVVKCTGRPREKAGFKANDEILDDGTKGFGEFTDSRDWRFVDRTSGYDCGRQ